MFLSKIFKRNNNTQSSSSTINNSFNSTYNNPMDYYTFDILYGKSVLETINDRSEMLLIDNPITGENPIDTTYSDITNDFLLNYEFDNSNLDFQADNSNLYGDSSNNNSLDYLESNYLNTYCSNFNSSDNFNSNDNFSNTDTFDNFSSCDTFDSFSSCDTFDSFSSCDTFDSFSSCDTFDSFSDFGGGDFF